MGSLIQFYLKCTPKMLTSFKISNKQTSSCHWSVWKKTSLYTLQKTLTGKRKHFQVLDQGRIQKFWKRRGEGCKTCKLAKYTYICKKHHCVWKKEVQPWMHPCRFLSWKLESISNAKKNPCYFLWATVNRK